MSLLTMPGAISEGARLAVGNSGAGALSNGAYMVLGFFLLVLSIIIFKYFDQITDFLFIKKKNHEVSVSTDSNVSPVVKANQQSANPEIVGVTNEQFIPSESQNSKRQTFKITHMIFRWVIFLTLLVFAVVMVSLVRF